jgi:hypothetical protein
MPTSLTAAHRKPPAERVILVVGLDTEQRLFRGGFELPS